MLPPLEGFAVVVSVNIVPELLVKLAVTLVLAFIVTVVVGFVPLAPPLQLVNVNPAAGVAVNVTTVPGA